MDSLGAKMTRGVAIVLTLAAVGIISLVLGEKTDSSLLTTAGFCCLGAASIWIGIETIITRRIVLRSRYDRRANETYVGIAAIAQGIGLVALGLFLAGIALLVHLELGAPLLRHLLRRPGALLILFGLFAMTTAVTVGMGYVEQKETNRFAYFLDLLTSRTLGVLVLVAIGVIAIGLGLLEVFAPDQFDELGGGFLKALYGLR